MQNSLMQRGSYVGSSVLRLQRHRLSVQPRRGLATEVEANGRETLLVLGGGWAGYQFIRKVDKVSLLDQDKLAASLTEIRSVRSEQIQYRCHKRERNVCHYTSTA